MTVDNKWYSHSYGWLGTDSASLFFNPVSLFHHPRWKGHYWCDELSSFLDGLSSDMFRPVSILSLSYQDNALHLFKIYDLVE